MIGTLLNIKPLIGMEDGIVVPLGQVRSRRQAYRKIADMVENVIGPQGKVKVAYVHAAALEEALKLQELVESRVTSVESIIAELSPALGVHTGPGTAGVCFYPVNN
jgi:DegV family protein with EDD domain